MHHYNLPPFASGEAQPLRGPRRREIGHGALAETALRSMIPPEDVFPYTIRVVSEVLFRMAAPRWRACAAAHWR